MIHATFIECSRCATRVSGLTPGGRFASWSFRGMVPPGWSGTKTKPICGPCYDAFIDESNAEAHRRRAAGRVLREKVREMFGDVGCHDGGCIYGATGGMQTNGGCGCIEKGQAPNEVMMAARRIREAAIAIIEEREAAK